MAAYRTGGLVYQCQPMCSFEHLKSLSGKCRARREPIRFFKGDDSIVQDNVGQRAVKNGVQL
jgi:hypothetical protein